MMRYKDRMETDLDLMERFLAQMKDAVDAKDLISIANIIVTLEAKVDNIRNMLDLEE